VELGRVTGSGPKGRILHEDVEAFVKSVMSGSVAQRTATPVREGLTALQLLPWPALDFSKFGATELLPLSRIKKISGPNLARNWAMIPHVTQFDEADITDLEVFRKSSNEALAKTGVKVTMLAFVMKACIAALKQFPNFNSSLDADGANLILKKYYHLGFAADTPNGLVVPVLRNCDQKGIGALATETAELAAKAREGKLAPTEMQGASFTISSLGGVGGTAFTPIINAPEVAILGLSKSEIKPKWNGKEFTPRLMLPLSLSYDHRVIDGAQAARFTTILAELLGDMRRVLL
jgi:pyruvate dehydrogenase E2 component (dihydrolipoamide acetyltransferase)